MKFRDSKYNSLIINQYNTIKEVTVIITPFCKGGCRHCLYYKNRIGDREWDNLWEQVVEYFGQLDYDNQKVIVAIEGGEVFSEELMTDEYIKQLRKMLKFIYEILTRKGKDHEWYIACSISLENIEGKGLELLKEFREQYPELKLNIAFSCDRILNKTKEERFFKNMNYFKQRDEEDGRKQLGIGVLMTEGFPERNYLRTLAPYAKTKVIDFAEPHMFEGNVFCYNGLNITQVYNDLLEDLDIQLNPCLRRGIPSLHHLDIYITSRGIKNGFHLLKKPWWIPENDWNRMQDDEEYRIFGYQQILDWYGCNDCVYLYQCQGMLWTSYYAQKNLYNYNKCLYK